MNPDSPSPSDQARALAAFAFGSQTHVADTSRPLAWLSPEDMHIDLSDPVQRRFGDYELLEKIGQGGMGVVYRARQHGLERDVALKLLAAGPWASDEFVARFRREARSAARMQHPNIVEIYEFGHRDGLNYFSMRLIEGSSLAQKLATDGRVPPREAAALLRVLAEAMDYAHRLGILHLDLKPANVLLTPEGTPLIADFGLARRIDAGHEGGNEEISGTPSYMAPEQALLRSHPLSAATDIYGLGAILYEAITGSAPFQGGNAQAVLERVVAEAPKSPRALHPGVPADLEAICLKCLEKDPTQRYASARALADDLGRFIEGRPVSVRPLGVVQRAQRWVRREPRVAAALGIAVSVLLVGTATTAWQWRHAVNQRNAAESAERLAGAERDRARIAGEIGAFLFANASEDEDDEDRASSLVNWLRKRWPGDEGMQADALTAFAESVSAEQRLVADRLLTAIIKVLGTGYRKQVIASLQTGKDPYRHLYSAMLAWSDTDASGTTPQFDAALRAAVLARPKDPFTLQVAAVFCPTIGNKQRCQFPHAASELVRLAPENMYHWLLLSMVSSDEAERREALHEAAKRTKFDDYLGFNYRAYASAFDAARVPAPSLIARPVAVLAPAERPEFNIALIEATHIALPSWQPLVGYCVPADIDTLPPQVRADCLVVGERMARSNGALLSRMIGVALVRNLARDTPLAEEMKQVRALYQYLGAMDAQLSPRQQLSYPSKRLLDDISNAGEMAAMQRRVEYFGIPGRAPADWQPENPEVLLTARERVDRAIAGQEQGAQLLEQGRYAEAVGALAPIEKATRSYLRDRNAWRVPRFLVTLGRARVGLGQFEPAEQNLLEAWEILQSFGPGAAGKRECALALLSLYSAMESAEPGKANSEKMAEWKRALAEIETAGASRSGS